MSKVISGFSAFVNMQKAFDWVDRDLLINNIDGNVYNAIKDMYSNTIAIMSINGFEKDMFSCNSGVRQGDVLSTTLFSIYINDLAKEIKCMNLGISVDEFLVSILLNVDNIAPFAEHEADLQFMIDKLMNGAKNVEWRLMNQKQILFILEISVHTALMFVLS